jgi:hypothetical protein
MAVERANPTKARLTRPSQRYHARSAQRNPHREVAEHVDHGIGILPGRKRA